MEKMLAIGRRPTHTRHTTGGQPTRKEGSEGQSRPPHGNQSTLNSWQQKEAHHMPPLLSSPPVVLLPPSLSTLLLSLSYSPPGARARTPRGGRGERERERARGSPSPCPGAASLGLGSPRPSLPPSLRRRLTRSVRRRPAACARSASAARREQMPSV
jgi:hypothetical protein